jgi:Protein of unknown function (DUF402)
VVVADGSDHTVLWLPPGSTYAIGDALFGDWKFEERLLRRGQLRVTRPDEAFSVFLFTNHDGTLRGWYVNLEAPQQRTELGFDYEDELLDIWVPVGAEPELLDEDELEEAVRRGFFSTERAAEIRANGERVLADPPWPTGWEDWQPDPAWQVPVLPHGWDELDVSGGSKGPA